MNRSAGISIIEDIANDEKGRLFRCCNYYLPLIPAGNRLLVSTNTYLIKTPDEVFRDGRGKGPFLQKGPLPAMILTVPSAARPAS